MARFWNLVLTINSLLLIGTAVFLVYSFGMMLIAFEWKRFVLVLTVFLVLVATEMVFTALMHD